ncbi:MAG: hypothetical protein MK209_00155 [Planctomycetes bacterium]|nr:hypothetical protein [Planctomycetota bacterium]
MIWVLGFTAEAWSQQGADSVVHTNDNLVVQEGGIPLILSAPHGGARFPNEWQVRATGVKVRDTNTFEIALALRDAIRRRVGTPPHLIASRVHRRHLDLNRDRQDSGAELGKEQLRLWQGYHEEIENATQAALKQGGGHALLIDLHGHGHDHGLIELGFAISAEELRREPSQLNDEDWVRGSMSLGARLDALGWKSVPSPARPAPKIGQAYFTGGYTVRRHRGDGLRSIQIELPPKPRRSGAEVRQPLVEGLADALLGLLVKEFALPPIPLDPMSTQGGALWGPGQHPWSEPKSQSLSRVAKDLPWFVGVYGIPILAGPDLVQEELRQGASKIVKYLDQNSDRLLDDVRLVDRLRSSGFGIVLYRRHAPVLADTRPWNQLELIQVEDLDAWLSRGALNERHY